MLCDCGQRTREQSSVGDVSASQGISERHEPSCDALCSKRVEQGRVRAGDVRNGSEPEPVMMSSRISTVAVTTGISRDHRPERRAAREVMPFGPTGRRPDTTAGDWLLVRLGSAPGSSPARGGRSVSSCHDFVDHAVVSCEFGDTVVGRPSARLHVPDAHVVRANRRRDPCHVPRCRCTHARCQRERLHHVEYVARSDRRRTAPPPATSPRIGTSVGARVSL